jgi:FKBP-type peptidyl-prolyl cis-trans isomerase FklB
MNHLSMKLKLLAILTVGALVCGARAEEKKELKEQKEKISYSYGMNIGSNLKAREIEIDYDVLLQGIKDSMEGKTPLLTEQEARQVLTAFQTEQRVKLEAKRKEQGIKNKAEGEKFLAENKTKPGVITTSSGLQYKILTEGTGPTPKTNDTVTVNYRGTFIDGTEFDSSYKRGQPASFSVNGVIKGWTEALSMMKVGSKWQLFVPSELGYKEFGKGNIPPNTTLLFETELVGIKPVAQPPQVTSDIIKVPSAEELKKGAKIEIIKPDQLPKEVPKTQNDTKK